MMRNSILLAVCLLASLVTFRVQAVKYPGTDVEVRHLLDAMENSGCTFTRNGTEYTGREAREHMQMKCDYTKAHIESAHAFIERIATQSSMTGRPYTIQCGDKVYPSAQWLSDERQRYRQEQTP